MAEYFSLLCRWEEAIAGGGRSHYASPRVQFANIVRTAQNNDAPHERKRLLTDFFQPRVVLAATPTPSTLPAHAIIPTHDSSLSTTTAMSSGLRTNTASFSKGDSSNEPLMIDDDSDSDLELLKPRTIASVSSTTSTLPSRDTIIPSYAGSGLSFAAMKSPLNMKNSSNSFSESTANASIPPATPTDQAFTTSPEPPPNLNSSSNGGPYVVDNDSDDDLWLPVPPLSHGLVQPSDELPATALAPSSAAPHLSTPHETYPGTTIPIPATADKRAITWMSKAIARTCDLYRERQKLIMQGASFEEIIGLSAAYSGTVPPSSTICGRLAAHAPTKQFLRDYLRSPMTTNPRDYPNALYISKRDPFTLSAMDLNDPIGRVYLRSFEQEIRQHYATILEFIERYPAEVLGLVNTTKCLSSLVTSASPPSYTRSSYIGLTARGEVVIRHEEDLAHGGYSKITKYCQSVKSNVLCFEFTALQVKLVGVEDGLSRGGDFLAMNQDWGETERALIMLLRLDLDLADGGRALGKHKLSDVNLKLSSSASLFT